MEADRDQAELIVQDKTHFTHIGPHKNDNQKWVFFIQTFSNFCKQLY